MLVGPIHELWVSVVQILLWFTPSCPAIYCQYLGVDIKVSNIFMLLLSHQIEQANDLITISISLINHPDQLDPCIQHIIIWAAMMELNSSGMCNDENMIEIAVVIVKRWQKCAYHTSDRLSKEWPVWPGPYTKTRLLSRSVHFSFVYKSPLRSKK